MQNTWLAGRQENNKTKRDKQIRLECYKPVSFVARLTALWENSKLVKKNYGWTRSTPALTASCSKMIKNISPNRFFIRRRIAQNRMCGFTMMSLPLRVDVLVREFAGSRHDHVACNGPKIGHGRLELASHQRSTLHETDTLHRRVILKRSL